MSLSWPDRLLTLEEWDALPEDESRRLELVEAPTARIPDVVVARTSAYEANPPRFAASDILLAVEILSDGTRRVDRILEFAEYADAGIPRYWVVDLEAAPELTAYVLVDGVYELAGRHTGEATLDVDGHPVSLDLAALTRR
jgi:Uma2 family endonuclease